MISFCSRRLRSPIYRNLEQYCSLSSIACTLTNRHLDQTIDYEILCNKSQPNSIYLFCF